MLTFGPLAFAAPLALIAFLALPALWMLLRATPPAPNVVIFAPIRLLQRLARTPETPQTTPWWLIALRLILAALVILALARPILQPDPASESDAPVLVIVDDGWTSAARWDAAQDAARARLEAARADGRRAAILFTAAPTERAPALRFAPAVEALARLDAHDPHAWAPDRASAAERLRAGFAADGAPGRIETVWITDGIATDDEGDRALARTASSAGALSVLTPPLEDLPLALAAVEASPDGFIAVVRRADGELTRDVSVTALTADGRAVARASGTFQAGQTEARFTARLPLDLRNRIARMQLDGEPSAGAVHLTGDRWRRPRVGLVRPEGGDGQPLLSDLHYAREALSGAAEIVSGDLELVLNAEPSVLVLVDQVQADDERISAFLEAGGLVIRFAGPRLAAAPDTLLPAPLRQGGRLFGGALAWDEAQGLSPFPDDSPFAGLSIPAEATVERQVLAEPGPALNARVWARLADGTPLVTADRRGEGWLVLFHVTAGPAWSSLPLSGLFPAMLERTLSLSDTGRAAAPTGGAWSLEQALTGRGVLTDPTGAADPIPSDQFSQARAAASTPPGLWRLGTAGAALNTVQPGDTLTPLARNLPGATYAVRGETVERRLAGPLLTLALILLAVDTIIALALAGRLPAVRRAAQAAPVLLAASMLTVLPPQMSEAQDAELGAAENALEVRLAYVLTGDARIDQLSRAGLSGLSRESTRRSAVEPAEPVGVNIEADPIVFYPVVYWPVTLDAPALSMDAARKVQAYLDAGGLIIFDTRDGAEAALRGEPHPGLVRTLDHVDLPPLEPIPGDHVIGRSFYLLDDFPGRYPGGTVWVEAAGSGASRDGVSSVVIGSADWAAAWAVDESGRPLAPVEGGPRQRELAIRFGVNVAMYALTGNYKADQVHVPAILERLGQE
jgi:hypothetical protein